MVPPSRAGDLVADLALVQAGPGHEQHHPLLDVDAYCRALPVECNWVGTTSRGVGTTTRLATSSGKSGSSASGAVQSEPASAR